MIETSEYKEIPATFIYRITDSNSLDDVKNGMNTANEVINAGAKQYGIINIIMDMLSGQEKRMCGSNRCHIHFSLDMD